MNSNRIEYRASAWAKFYGSVSILAGVGMIAFILNSEESTNIIFSIIVSVSVCWGIYSLYTSSEPMVFDKINGVFLKGRGEIQSFEENQAESKHIKLKDIYAIQLISEYVLEPSGFNDADDDTYHSYEINLVLKNSRRINVIDHGDGFQVLADAKELSNFLGVPIWNGIQDSE